MSGSIDFGEFIRVIEKQKERASKFSDESDMIDAYVACGGNEDKSGFGECLAAPGVATEWSMSTFTRAPADAPSPFPFRRARLAVKKETLIKIIKDDFGLKIDIEELIRAIDEDDSGEVEYDEFKLLLSRRPPPAAYGSPHSSSARLVE